MIGFKGLLAGIVVVAACSIAATPPAFAQDAASLCAGRGTVDVAAPIPTSLMEQAAKLFGGDDTDSFAATVYRCVNGEVWLCTYGANLVCDHANVAKANPGATQWCKENPGARSVPMAATGHDTIYSYVCAGKTARISRTIAKVDERGFIAGNWKRLK